MGGYGGNTRASVYYSLWFHKSHALRRVDTIALIDRSALDHSITVDIRLRELVDVLNRVNRKGIHAQLPIPFITLEKQVLFDVDLKSVAGTAVHLSRRHVNQEVTAYIFVGLCLRYGLAPAGAEKVYFAFLEILQSHSDERTPIETPIMELLDDAGLVIELAGQSDFSEFVTLLMDRYIQCIEMDSLSGAIDLIKMRIRTIRRPISWLDGPTLIDASDPSRQLSGGATGVGLSTLKRLAEFARWGLRSAPQALGGVATRLELDMPSLGSGYLPSHVRVVAPPGIIIEDVEVTRDRNPIPRESAHLSTRIHHQRVVFLDRGLPSPLAGTYHVSVKINTKRGYFVIPALAAILYLLLIDGFALTVGPRGWLANDAALTGALLLVPSLIIAFLARDGEHELMSQVLGWARVLLVTCCTSTLVVGILIATLGPITPESGRSLHMRVTVWATIISFMLSLAVFLLFTFHLYRIEKMRSLVQFREHAVALALRSNHRDEVGGIERRFTDAVQDFRYAVQGFLYILAWCLFFGCAIAYVALGDRLFLR
jgi:hypothetical protein